MAKTQRPFHILLEEAGHVLKRGSYGDIDIFVRDNGFHNGPGCELCGESWCHHCEGEIEPCTGKKDE